MYDQSSPAAPMHQGFGVGYKPRHCKLRHLDGLIQYPGPARWIKVLAKNYRGNGGRPTRSYARSANL